MRVFAASVFTALGLALVVALVWPRQRERPAAMSAAPAPVRAISQPPAPPRTLAAIAPAPGNARVHQLLLELTGKHRFGKPRQNALRGMLPYFSVDDLQAALDETYGNDACNDLTHVLLERLATVDANAAIAFAREHHFGVDPPWWYSVLGGLAQPQLVLADLQQLPSGETRTGYLSYAAGRWATSDRAAAVEFALHAAPPEARQQVLSNVVLFTAHQDPAGGLALALQYQAQIGDPDFVQHLVTDWAANDFSGALEAVRTLPDAETQQRALRGVAAVAATRDPASARVLIEQVQDDAARTELYRQAARQWLLRDPAAAHAWLATTTALSDADKQSLLAGPDPTPRLTSTP